MKEAAATLEPAGDNSGGWERPRLAGWVNARIRTEIRQILPYAVTILVCEIALWLALHGLSTGTNNTTVTYIAGTIAACAGGLLPVAICALTLQPFLAEFHNATMAQLLVQPVSRQKLWNQKFATAAVSLVAAAILALALFHSHFGTAKVGYQFAGLLLSFFAAILCAAPLMAMLAKRSLAALLSLLGYVLATILFLALMARANELAMALLPVLALAAAIACSGPLSYLLENRKSAGALVLLGYVVFCGAGIHYLGGSFPTPASTDVAVFLVSCYFGVLSILTYSMGYARFQRMEL